MAADGKHCYCCCGADDESSAVWGTAYRVNTHDRTLVSAAFAALEPTYSTPATSVWSVGEATHPVSHRAGVG